MKTYLLRLFTVILCGILFFLPSKGKAIDVHNLDPGYYVSNSTFLAFDTASVAFDSNHNLYTVSKYDFNTFDPDNTIDILKFYSSTNYSTYSVYYTYIGGGISGLEFDQSGNLYIAEFGRKNGFLDIGRIDKIDSSLNVSTVVELNEFRPTGVAVDSKGKIYFPGRLESKPYEGDLHVYDPDTYELDDLVSGFVGTGIAIDVSDNIYCSTTSLSVTGQESRTIYKFNDEGDARTVFANTVPTVEELTFDHERKNLYVLEVTDFDPNQMHPPEMVTISPIVAIDVKPGEYPNCMNINGKGVIPVAINGNEYFDVYDVNLWTLDFAGLSVRVKGNGQPQCGYEDWNDDGYLDLVCKFEDDPDTWTPGDGIATLSFYTTDGTLVEKDDSICIRP